MRNEKMVYAIAVYRLKGQHAIPLRRTKIGPMSEASAKRVLKEMRLGLPSDCGAGLEDSKGWPVR